MLSIIIIILYKYHVSSGSPITDHSKVDQPITDMLTTKLNYCVKILHHAALLGKTFRTPSNRMSTLLPV